MGDQKVFYRREETLCQVAGKGLLGIVQEKVEMAGAPGGDAAQTGPDAART